MPMQGLGPNRMHRSGHAQQHAANPARQVAPPGRGRGAERNSGRTSGSSPPFPPRRLMQPASKAPSHLLVPPARTVVVVVSKVAPLPALARQRPEPQGTWCPTVLVGGGTAGRGRQQRPRPLHVATRPPPPEPGAGWGGGLGGWEPGGAGGVGWDACQHQRRPASPSKAGRVVCGSGRMCWERGLGLRLCDGVRRRSREEAAAWGSLSQGMPRRLQAGARKLRAWALLLSARSLS